MSDLQDDAVSRSQGDLAPPAGAGLPPVERPADDGAPTAAGGDELRLKLLELEYEYLTQSSFQTDTLRNQFVQFYLVIVGVAATALVGLAQIQSRDGQTLGALTSQWSWVYSMIAAFIGALGVVMLRLFVRLRRVVMECLQGTVLLKGYVMNELGGDKARRLGSAMLWDDLSVPTDESYGSASFVLIFVFMLLDSSMFFLASLFWWASRQPPLSPKAVVLWSFVIFAAALTLQVAVYRLMLATELRNAMRRDRLASKYEELGMGLGTTTALRPPERRRPVLTALLIGGIAATLLALAAAQVTWGLFGR
jgi:hypothetical protein